MQPSHPSADTPRNLHRIRDARLAEGITLETMARRMNQRASLLKKQESADTDLRLSDLFRWQAALNVPLIELLAEPDYGLSETIRRRAGLTRIAKTANSILRESSTVPVERLAQTLVDQLVELMPELKEIGAWHDRGIPKSTKDMGRIAEFIVERDWWVMGEDCQM